MDKIKYVALLRGINVGGNNIIKMTELKKLFEEMGFSDVITFIQTGNVIFYDIEKDKTKLIKKIENKLFEKLKSNVNIALLTLFEMEEIMNKKPKNFGENNEKYRYNVIFLIEPLMVNEAIKEFNPREGVDSIHEGKKVLYFMILIEKRTKSRISKIVESKIYPKLTIRNWNTTEKLYELMKNK
ncbi:DUF1697 domain-containing protein [Treponema endosymbiont of Eucomonympha sp.]|uniref:DUF1697 domain-containing protein n=1 Tax=Treponema endosymbiont of Eucomonympha sp. TaxID=1580831 RepID=UPI0007513DCB|nr:DUF1697 domain-containing protein [Treponema endosymbiont of Eucomonympha sp.]